MQFVPPAGATRCPLIREPSGLQSMPVTFAKARAERRWHHLDRKKQPFDWVEGLCLIGKTTLADGYNGGFLFTLAHLQFTQLQR